MRRVRAAPPDLDARIARRLRQERDARQLTLDALAERSGVSRAMISRVERGESSPTAALLGRLCAGLDITLSTLFADVDAAPSPVARRADQTVWRDPATGYVRRAVSPPNTGSVQDIVDVTLPAGARVAYPAASYRGIDQHVLVLDGTLEFGNGGEVHRLDAGDCLFVAQAADSWFRNPGRRAVRYLVVLSRLAAAPEAPAPARARQAGGTAPGMNPALRPRRVPASLVPREAQGPGPGHNGGPPLDGSGLAWIWRRASQRAWKTPPREIALARLRQAEALGLSYREFTAVLMDRGQRLCAAVVVIDDGRTLAAPAACERLARLAAARTLVGLRGPDVDALPESLRGAVDRVVRLDAPAALDAAIADFLAAFHLPPAAVFLVGTQDADLAAAERHGLALFKWATSYFAAPA